MGRDVGGVEGAVSSERWVVKSVRGARRRVPVKNRDKNVGVPIGAPFLKAASMKISDLH